MVPQTRAVVPMLLSILLLYGCAAAPRRLPYGGYDLSTLPETRALGQAWLDSQTACRSPIVTARALVRGKLKGRRIDAWLWIGVDTGKRQLRLESTETGPPHFTLLASYSYGTNRTDEATLLMVDDRWVVRSSSRELIEVVLGVPLSAPELQSVLTGCPHTPGSLTWERFDAETIKMVSTESDTTIEVFMRQHRPGSPWMVFAFIANVPGRPVRWRVDPGPRSRGVLESTRLTSVEWNGETGRLFDLTFSFDRPQTSTSAADSFSLSIPESTTVLPLDSVRLNASVPLLAH